MSRFRKGSHFFSNLGTLPNERTHTRKSHSSAVSLSWRATRMTVPAVWVIIRDRAQDFLSDSSSSDFLAIFQLAERSSSLGQ